LLLLILGSGTLELRATVLIYNKVLLVLTYRN